MIESPSTCWTAIRGAAGGNAEERDRFARLYGPVVGSYLSVRWRRDRWSQDIEDATQEVFLECFRAGGALTRADPVHSGGFRAFLFGVTRNVAARVESRSARRREHTLDTEAGDAPNAVAEEDLAAVFDRAWAQSIMRQAWELLERHATSEPRKRRLSLLRERFDEGLAIRDIAARSGEDPAWLHQEYAGARREFQHALREAVAFHLADSSLDVDRECRRLIEILE